MSDCLFCRVIRGETPAKKVYEDEHTYAFEDINPKAPTHLLVIPKKHIVGLKEATPEDAELIGRCHLVAADLARARGIENGYRTVLNVGPGAGQSVFHLHVHLLGGRSLSWPRDKTRRIRPGPEREPFRSVLPRHWVRLSREVLSVKAQPLGSRADEKATRPFPRPGRRGDAGVAAGFARTPSAAAPCRTPLRGPSASSRLARGTKTR